MSNVRSLCLVSCSSAQSSCSFCLVLLLMVQQYFSLSDSFLVLVVCRMYVHFATIYVSLWCMPYVYIVLFVSVPSFMFFFFLFSLIQHRLTPEGRPGVCDVTHMSGISGLSLITLSCFLSCFSAQSSCSLCLKEDIPLVEVMYLVFTRMSGESYRRGLGVFVVVLVLLISSAD